MYFKIVYLILHVTQLITRTFYRISKTNGINPGRRDICTSSLEPQLS